MTKYVIDYKLSTGDDILVSKEKNFTFSIGDGQLSTELEKCVKLSKKGELRTFLLLGKDVFGETSEEAKQFIAKKDLPIDIKLNSAVNFTTPTGDEFIGNVVKINKNNALIDFNHTLSDTNLIWSIKIIDLL